jgi:hypothetical protein
VVPAGVVTVTSTVPFPFGETAVIDVAEFTVKLFAPVEPNMTASAPVRSVPVIVTVVPPPGEPWLGSTLLTAATDPARSVDSVGDHLRASPQLRRLPLAMWPGRCEAAIASPLLAGLMTRISAIVAATFAKVRCPLMSTSSVVSCKRRADLPRLYGAIQDVAWMSAMRPICKEPNRGRITQSGAAVSRSDPKDHATFDQPGAVET